MAAHRPAILLAGLQACSGELVEAHVHQIRIRRVERGVDAVTGEPRRVDLGALQRLGSASRVRSLLPCVGRLAGREPAGRRRPRALEDRVDLRLDLGRNLLAAVNRTQAGEVLGQFGFDSFVALPETLQRGEDVAAARREVRRPVPRHHRHTILRQQTILHEVDDRIDAPVRCLEPSPAEAKQEDPPIRDHGPGPRRQIGP
jgi:hypothetical protein